MVKRKNRKESILKKAQSIIKIGHKIADIGAKSANRRSTTLYYYYLICYSEQWGHRTNLSRLLVVIIFTSRVSGRGNRIGGSYHSYGWTDWDIGLKFVLGMCLDNILDELIGHGQRSKFKVTKLGNVIVRTYSDFSDTTQFPGLWCDVMKSQRDVMTSYDQGSQKHVLNRFNPTHLG